MKLQLFPELGCEFILQDNEFWHNDGMVSDLQQWKYRLDVHYDDNSLPLAEESTGHCSQYWWGRENHVHFAYRDLGNPLLNLFVVAHESTHGLTILNQEEVLQSELTRAGFNEDLMSLDPETKANVSGLCALLRRGTGLVPAISLVTARLHVPDDIGMYFNCS